MSPNQATAIALLAAVAWGSGNVAQKTILQHLDGWQATAITSLIGALVLLPLVRREARGVLPPARGSGPLLLAVSVLFTFASTVMQFGYGLTSVANAGFLVNTSAVLTPILGWIFLAHRVPLAIWPASLATLFGIFLMAGGTWAGLGPGDLLSLASASGFAVWTLAVGAHVMRYHRPALLTCVSLAVCGGVCAGVSLGVSGLPTLGAVLAALPEIVLIGLVSKGLAYVLMAKAQQHLAASTVAILVSAEAVFGALFAAMILGETLDAVRGTGALFIILSVAVAARVPAPPAERARA
ncbi:DMT family transporter [Rhodobacter sp. KR11]|uniref:DMT family transporter n=1 Tax=Rhodobacter sp. KR11 TaxID=2974588 RepID=UPI00222152AA|nr:DMT family transporter [Rhodobacter sp. KR11]MCW1920574.1 DMT family transporter [Rhodobacter sp. KR11]